MIDQEKVIKGLELCRYDPDPGMPLKSEVSCDICPYWDDTYGCRMNDMFDDAIALLKAQEKRRRLEVHNIGNVDRPDGVTDEQFHAIMNNVVEALEHTDRGEAWPYEGR